MLIFLQKLISIITYTVLALIIFEFMAAVSLRYFYRQRNTNKELRRTDLINPFFKKSDSYGPTDTWRERYHQEINAIFNNAKGALNKWQALGQWSAPRYHGQYVNIDKYNLRRTINHKHNVRNQIPIETQQKICVFGGSLVWGWEVRDEGTIPSRLSALRNNTIIENHGQLGYVSSQSLVAFIQRLKFSSKPDLVIFIEGLNDIYSAYQSNLAGVEQNAIARKNRFEAKAADSILKLFFNKSRLFTLLNKLFRNHINTHNPEFNTNNDALAQAVVDNYKKNILLAEQMASANNIKSVFVWAPSLFDKPQKTPYEQELLTMINSCKDLYACVKKIISADAFISSKINNLSDIFSHQAQAMYVDPWHYNEYANTLIANKVSELIPAVKILTKNKVVNFN